MRKIRKPKKSFHCYPFKISTFYPFPLKIKFLDKSDNAYFSIRLYRGNSFGTKLKLLIYEKKLPLFSYLADGCPVFFRCLCSDNYDFRLCSKWRIKRKRCRCVSY